MDRPILIAVGIERDAASSAVGMLDAMRQANCRLYGILLFGVLPDGTMTTSLSLPTRVKDATRDALVEMAQEAIREHGS